MAPEQSTTTRFLNGKFAAEIATDGFIAEVTISDRETSKRRVAGAFTFLHTGDVIFTFMGDPNGRDLGVAPPDAQGKPDEGVAALLYAGATLEHPFTEDGTVGDIKVSPGEHAAPKIRENLGAIGVDFAADLPKPDLEYEAPERWLDDIPSVSAEKVILDLAEHFAPALPTKTPATV